MSDGIFACWEQRFSQRPLSPKHPEFALSVAVVDTRRVLRETITRGVYTGKIVLYKSHAIPLQILYMYKRWET
jgi:hypothetical protein